MAGGRSGVTGDFAKLAALQRALAGVEGGALHQVLARQLGEESLKLVRAGFRGGVDPYGHPWAPHRGGSRRAHTAPGGASLRGAAATRGGSRILVKTARLRNSFTYRVAGRGFVVGTNVRYAAVHQDGGVVTTKARANVHTRTGRFKSRAAAAKIKGKKVKVSFTAAHSFKMPQRRMLPVRTLGPIWTRAFDVVTKRAITKFFAHRA